MNNLIFIVIIGMIFISLFFLVGQQEVKEDVIKEITNKTPEMEKVLNETKAIEVEQLLEEIEKSNITIRDKELIVNQLVSQDYAEIIVRVTDKEKIDDILATLSKNEFKLEGIADALPPYIFSGNITKEGLEKIKDNQYIERISIVQYGRGALGYSVPLINANDVWKLQLFILSVIFVSTFYVSNEVKIVEIIINGVIK